MPYLKTNDCQFGYKTHHSTTHAIEIIRTIEQKQDAHVCMLDASSAFDSLSWKRIKDQLVKRDVPSTLLKIVMTQLFSTKIIVCDKTVFFPRVGVKQGGILSGIIFAACYDDLADATYKTGAGLLVECTNNKYMLICILIYADDIVLISASPNGLKSLIETAFLFADKYDDLTFNASKSCIMRFGKHRKPAVSVCGIPITERYIYLGVEVGRAADPQKAAASKMYTNTHILLAQNYSLHKCNVSVKNMCIKTYGNVYSIENLQYIGPKLRQAHRYLTKSVHRNWRVFADLNGPEIRSRFLYTAYGLDSLEVIHRKRRNMFLINSRDHENNLIRCIIGNLRGITA